MDVVEPASDGCRRSVPICRHRLRVHGVEAVNAERPLDGSRLASSPSVQGVEGVFLPRGEMAQEILGRPVAPADRCRALEILVPKPFRELADRLVLFLERAEGSRSRRRRVSPSFGMSKRCERGELNPHALSGTGS
jgi:hypothetical protein